MASGVFNRGLYELASAGTDLLNDTLKIMLVKSTYAFNRDHNVVSDVVAHEISSSGYSRQTLSSVTVTENDTDDAAYLDAADPEWTGVASGQTVGMAILFRDTGDDATSPLIGAWDLVNFSTSLGDWKIPWASKGLIKFTSQT